MEIVINIPKTLYRCAVSNLSDGDKHFLLASIKNGTVLEPHGRLIDTDKLLVHEMYGIFGGREMPCVLRGDIEDTDTILEATKGYSNAAYD